MSDLLAPLAAAKIYRAEADECLRRAEATAVPGVRGSYHSLALSYIRIAEDMEAAAQKRALRLAREMLTVTKN